MTEKTWLKVAEAAEYLAVSEDSVREWIQSRGLPAHRVGRLWRLNREEVDAWVKSGQAASTPGETGDDEGKSHE